MRPGTGCRLLLRSIAFVCLALALQAVGGCKEDPPAKASRSEIKPTLAVASAPSDARAPALAALEARELTWVYEQSPAGPMQVVVAIPARSAADVRLPVLIALHGRGESFKGRARGSRAWIDDYGLLRAFERLKELPLTPLDLQGIYDQQRLLKLNEQLRREPYRGLIVVCPYTPDILAGDRPFSAASPLARFLVDDLLPRVYREAPAILSPESTGIDGVSLGGRAAILVGLARAQSFGAISGLQPAFDVKEVGELVRQAKLARERNPKFSLRLLTSDEDFFLVSTASLSNALNAAQVLHEYERVPGPHDYEFNRGPGVYRMLMFHDRALRGQATAGDAQR